MKVKIVKDNLIQEFQQKFEVLYFDKELGFNGDDKLISMVSAGLTY